MRWVGAAKRVAAGIVWNDARTDFMRLRRRRLSHNLLIPDRASVGAPDCPNLGAYLAQIMRRNDPRRRLESGRSLGPPVAIDWTRTHRGGRAWKPAFMSKRSPRIGTESLSEETGCTQILHAAEAQGDGWIPAGCDQWQAHKHSERQATRTWGATDLEASRIALITIIKIASDDVLPIGRS